MGERSHWARASAAEVTTAAQEGTLGWKRTARLIGTSNEIARRVGTPYALAWAEGTTGLAAYLRGNYAESLDRCLHAEEMLRESGGGAQWEAATLRIFAANSLALLGRLKQLAEAQPAWVRDALDRGDLYAAVNLRIGFANAARLVADDPLAAREDVAAAMHQWSKQGTHLEHFYELVALVNADLYEGKMADARSRVLAQWRPMRRALLTMVQNVRIHLWRMRGQTTLACAAMETKDRAARLAEASNAAHRIECEKAAVGDPVRAPAPRRDRRACAARPSGPRRSTPRRRVEADATDHGARRGGRARAAAALELGGEEGRALVDEADAWMRGLTVKSPERLAATVAPWVPRVKS